MSGLLAHDSCKMSCDDRIELASRGQTQFEESIKETSHTYQREAFVYYVRNDALIFNDDEDEAVQADVVDSVNQAAGLPVQPVSLI